MQILSLLVMYFDAVVVDIETFGHTVGCFVSYFASKYPDKKRHFKTIFCGPVRTHNI